MAQTGENGEISFAARMDTEKLMSDAREAQEILRGIGKTAEGAGSSMDNMMKTIGKGVAAYFSVEALVRFSKEIINVRSEIQSLEVSFNTLTGSAEVGGKLLSQIREFAVSTPMQMNDLAKGAQTLLAFNTAAEDVMPIMKALGDVSMGDSQKFQSLTLAFSQMSATGKLMGQDLNQMINAGFNPLSVMAEKTGKSMSQLKDEMSDGAISAEMVKQAFMDATSEGGKFYGMLEAQSHTLNGAISNLQGAIQDTFNSIGEASEGAIAGAVNLATELVKNYEKLGSVLMGIVSTYGAYKAAVMTTTTVTNVQTAAAHYEEAKALEALMTVEQREELVKRGLKETDEAYLVEAKKMVAANVEEAESALQRARAEVSASAHALNARRAEYMQAKEIVAAKKLELEAAIESGEAKKIEAAQTALNTAEERKNAAAKAFQAAAADKNAKQTAVETAAKAANSAQTAANTAAQTANASATNVLALAKAKLVKALNKVKAALAANPYAAAAAAITALAYGIYKLATYETQAEKAHKEFVKSVEEGRNAIDAEAAKVDTLFRKLEKAKEGTDEWKSAREKIISQYGTYLKNLGIELDTVEDIAAAHIKVKNAVLEEARAKQYDSAIGLASANAAKEQGDVFAKIRDKINSTNISKELKDSYFEVIKKALEDYASTGNETFMKLAVKNWRQLGFDEEFNRYSRMSGTAKTMYESSPYNAAKIESFRNFTYTNSSDFALFDKYKSSVVQLNDEMQKAEDMFGGSAKKAAESAGETKKSLQELRDEYDKLPTSEKTVENATYKEIKAREKQLSLIGDVKKQVEWLQKQFDYTTRGSKEYNDLQKRIEDLQKKTGKGADKEARDEQKRADEQAKLGIQEAARKIDETFAIEEAKLAERQRANDLLEEGTKKAVEQYAIDKEKELIDIRKIERQFIEDFIEGKKIEWQKANTGKGDSAWMKEWEEKYQNLSREDLPEWQQSFLVNYESNVQSVYNKNMKAAYDSAIADFMTYKQRRQKIIEEYARKEANLYTTNDAGEKVFIDGASQENMDVLSKRRDEAIYALDSEITSKSATFNRWLNEISGMTVKQLKKLLESAKKALQTLKNDPNADPKKLAEAEMAVKVLEDTIEQAALSPEEEELEEWTRYCDLIEAAGAAFSDLGNTIGGETGEILTHLGNIFKSTSKAIKGIADMANKQITAIVDMSEAASKAIMAAQNAVAILAIIQAIYTIINELKNLVDKNMDTSSGFGKTLSDFLHFLTDAETMLENIGWSLLSIFGLDPVIASLIGSTQSKKRHSEREQEKKDIEEIEQEYKDLERQIESLDRERSKLFGQSAVDAIKRKIELLWEEYYKIGEQVDKEKDKDKQLELLDKMYDILTEIVGLEEEMYDSIFGEDITSAVERFGDALTDAWEQGVDSSEAANKYIRESIRKTALEAILDYTQASAKIEAIRKSIKNALANDGIIDDSERSEIENMAQQLMDDIRDKYEWAADLFKEDSERSAQAAGIATASQDSVDELNGRFTAIQGHTYSINENVGLLLHNSNAILNSVMGIEATVAETRGLLQTVRNDLHSVIQSNRVNVSI